MENVVVFLVCIISGIFTGLLGIGGGLIIVPAFLVILPLFNITTISTHEIIGISSTVVLLNSLAGLFYRRGEEYLEKRFLIKSTIFIILGTIISAYFSSFAPIKPIFGLYCLVALTSIYLIKKDVYFDFKGKYREFLLNLTFALIGAISAAIGIGGAVLFATALKCFTKKTPKELLPTITFFVAFHALFAFLGKLSSGIIILNIIPIALVASFIGAKIGVKISKKLSSNAISNMMIAVLILGIIKIGFEIIK